MGGIREDLGLMHLNDLMVQNIESLKTFSVVEEDDNGKQKDVIYHRVGMNGNTFTWLNSFMEKVSLVEFQDLEIMYKKKLKSKNRF